MVKTDISENYHYKYGYKQAMLDTHNNFAERKRFLFKLLGGKNAGSNREYILLREICDWSYEQRNKGKK